MKRPLRTLFYGLKHEHSAGKLLTLSKMRDDFEIVAVADDRARATPSYRADPLPLDGLKIVGEDEALAMKDIDAVFVEVANNDLMEIARVYAGRGVPMHCDKPCGETMGPYREVVETCRAKGVPMQMGYMFRANPGVRFVHRAVREGWLGNVVSVEADMNHDYGDDSYQRYVGTFRGGILYNLGCHLVDLVLPMMEGDMVRAHNVTGVAKGDGPECLNRCAALLEWPSATVFLRACSRVPDGLPRRRLRVDGTKGVIDLSPIERFDGVSLTLDMTLASPAGGYAAGRHVVDLGVQTDRYMDQLREFAEILRGERENPSWLYDHDLKVHETTLEACGYDRQEHNNPRG